MPTNPVETHPISSRASSSILTRRQALVRGGAALLGGAAALSAPRSDAQFSTDRPRRVIWITVDSLRADALGCLGYDKPTSPWIDELAKRSVLCTNTMAPSDGTQRSVPAYMAGQHITMLHNRLSTARGLPANTPCIPRAFQAAGYKTFAWSTNPKVAPGYGMTQGFDRFELMLPIATTKAAMHELVDRVASDYTYSDRPEFIYIHTMDVHVPYVAPHPYDEMFSSGRNSPYADEGWLRGDDRQLVISNESYFSEHHAVEQSDIDFWRSQYDSAIRYTDARLPELLDALRFRADRDLLILTSDHGEQFFERGFCTHGKDTHIEEIHVPLLFHWDGFSPRRVDKVSSLLDLYPTLAGLFDLEIPEGLPGQSLLPELNGEATAANRVVYAEGNPITGPSGCAISNAWYYYVETDRYRHRPWLDWPFEEALYDRANDPRCLANVLNEREDVAEESNKLLRAMNPRLERWTTGGLRSESKDIKYGEDVIASDWSRSAQESTDSVTGLDIGIEQPLSEITVNVPNTQEYVLEFDYALEHGAVQLELIELEEEVLSRWSYQLRKPSGGTRTLRTVLRLREGPHRITVELAAESAGLTLAPPRLIPAEIPRLQLIELNKIDPPEHEVETISEDERERLRALGYFE